MKEKIGVDEIGIYKVDRLGRKLREPIGYKANGQMLFDNVVAFDSRRYSREKIKSETHIRFQAPK